ncbi:DUF485 domain-containing protein [Glycomyces buryatensis]|uniref:DUF485 domain-containing protein n=1 Tax=Glycomyces buryatensis TaxID=2570927 RepID=A0A4S8Q3B2_9ACTN|nr:DUF485 domain-containing protein [Glycomyces buryatensis]THV38663.1 DUF485 domain-containing protein [Glycomyces buryatensis]
MATTPTRDGPPPDVAEHEIAALHDDPRFVDLKRRLFRFIVPATIAFLAWFLLYVVLSGYARDFMGTVLFGNINIALVFGLLQFISTFGIAWAYSRYAAREVDPYAQELHDEIHYGENAQ